MDKKIEITDLLTPVLDIRLKRVDIQILNDVKPDVEFLLVKSIELGEHARFEECVECVQAVLDQTWEELNTGHWSLVQDSERTVYSAASLLKVVALVQEALQSSTDSTISWLEQAVKTADLGLLLGNSHRDQLTRAAHVLSQAVNLYQPRVNRNDAVTSAEAPKLHISTDDVCVLHCPSLETFSSLHFYPRIPAKLTGCMSYWPALRLWPDLNYLLETAGSRTVPIELGSSYTQVDWSQRLMPLRQFITQHITGTSNQGIGYLAQHRLFDQVPELRKDIIVPDYCACSEAEGEEDVDINAWFGPGGTVSPLHHDPKHNLLSQVVGKKQVTLYAPSMTDRLYPHEGRLLSNTSRVDPEAPDYKQFPKYRDTQAFLCLLSPGDMLYIPPRWWHHVRSLDMSFSVSFWWS